MAYAWSCYWMITAVNLDMYIVLKAKWIQDTILAHDIVVLLQLFPSLRLSMSWWSQRKINIIIVGKPDSLLFIWFGHPILLSRFTDSPSSDIVVDF
jgi:hypothetical protein